MKEVRKGRMIREKDGGGKMEMLSYHYLKVIFSYSTKAGGLC